MVVNRKEKHERENMLVLRKEREKHKFSGNSLGEEMKRGVHIARPMM